MQKENSALICGIEKEIIERIIYIIKEKYPLAEEATYYLETNTGLLNNTGVRNIKDMLSHFHTIIKHDLTFEERKEQLAGAEEHLRRAIIEPYERAVYFELKNIIPFYNEYKEKIIPVLKKLNLPEEFKKENIDRRISAIKKLIRVGRAAKGENRWNEKWQEGVECFIQAYEDTTNLKKKLQDAIYLYKQFTQEKKAKYYFIWGIIATILCFILGSIILIIH